MRVVSLLPSASETLCLLGGSDLLVGRSHECDFPSDIHDRPVLTGQITETSPDPAEIDRSVSAALAEGRSLYQLDAQLLRELKPDLILTQDLCAVCSIDLESVRRIASGLDPAPEILSLNPETVEAVLDDVLRVGQAIGREGRARAEATALRERMHRAMEFVTPYVEGPSVAFLEWTDPIYVGGHWTPQLIERAGGRHPLNPTYPKPGTGAAVGPQQAERVAGPSTRVGPEDVARSEPEAVIVCPCGVDLAGARAMAENLRGADWYAEFERRRAERRVPGGAIVDGNQMFNRPGPRLFDAFEFLVGWLQDRPELIPEGFPWEEWSA